MTWIERADGGWDVDLPAGRWAVEVELCLDPNCPSEDAMFRGTATDGREVRFAVDLAEGSSDAVDELARSLPEEVRRTLRREQQERRHLQRVTLPRSGVTSGKHVLFSSLLSADPSVFEAGGGHVDAFELDGERWVLDESYCPNPDCRCNEGMLAFLRLGGGNDGFDAMADLDSVPVLRTVYGSVDRNRALQVLAHYVALRDRLQERIRDHYEAVKAVGRRSLVPIVRARKPSRNGPCPCGSGKRYKACCGRADLGGQR